MDNLTKEQRRKNMQNIRSTGTIPEEIVAEELRRKKIYCARNVKKIKGKPDFVFRRKKVAVFIDSDFWHGHPKRAVEPKTNKKYWAEKIKSNKLRDKRVNRELRAEGWKVVRVWEHDIKKNIHKVIKRIETGLSKNKCNKW